MPGNPLYKLDRPEEAVNLAASTAVRGMDKWREVLKPLIDTAIDEMKADGFLSASIADAFDDFGRYWRTKGAEIRAERDRLGLKSRPPKADS